ncbi:hypothetical protein HER10_EVM0013394 [Colletotrichum scovillei]|uniref:SSCRP protein n=1 Tax=Colletotrichum scovillei TaxID=1209932 RepID=A0A9P7R1X8_9PEZI|nr:uncharacterized protein HER10_EVM0013394 [Colletotrichum scovillei]KAF4786101.1 hypothetical protein HER10_EVM0013394 [Colletotrichum scovillei]KAG7048062.1 SSCRP protein [Colletotrichum scovillei]KAG7065227.1 SSCRP protein [Colletotrichum scovillei]KAG7067829.1 SSCRP protein [Colletotrichum scovillei]
MCGPDTCTKPRGGALAVLNQPCSQHSPTTPKQRLRGDLAFHTPGQPGCSFATHARITGGEGCDLHSLSEMVVVIHQSGDLTRRLEDCGLFERFAFSGASILENGSILELALERPVSLEVGDDGIIGRRVSVFPGTGMDHACAEGIVGFNFVNAL